MRKTLLAGAAAAAALAAAPTAAGAASWTIVSSPNVNAGNNLLNGVSARSTTDAWAVGSTCCAFDDSGLGSLAMRWNGTRWSIVPSPDTKFNDDVLNGVAQISANDAWAVGQIKRTGFRSPINPFLLHWNGQTWSTATAPAGVAGSLAAVSATSSGDVWAVGSNRGA